MKTDIEIAQETKMLPIKDVAAQYGISEDDLELYGKYKAKISNELWNEVRKLWKRRKLQRSVAKRVLVQL